MKKIEINNISPDFYINKRQIFYRDNFILKKINSINSIEDFFVNKIRFVIEKINKDEIIIRDSEEGLRFLDINSSIVNKQIRFSFPNSNQIKHILKESIILRNMLEDDFWRILKVNDNGEIIWQINYNDSFYSIVEDKMLIIQSEKKDIECFRLEDGVTLWQTSFKDLVQSETVHTYPELIEHNQKLYFQLQSENRKGVFCIDVNTGKEITLYIDCYGFLIQDEDFVYTSKYENILCKINPKTNECEEWDVDELIKSNGFESISDHRCVAQDGKVYFTQTLGDKKAKLGVLDTLNKKLIFKHEFEAENGGIGSVQVQNNRIYVHTQDNTLHIFEEENENL